MLQTAIVYAVVAVAAAWTLWRVVLPASARTAILKAMGREVKEAGGCGGCSCGDGKGRCH